MVLSFLFTVDRKFNIFLIKKKIFSHRHIHGCIKKDIQLTQINTENKTKVFFMHSLNAFKRG